MWDACSDALITFNEDHLSDELAFILENDLLLHAVNKVLAEKPSVNVVYNAKVNDLELPVDDSTVSKVKLENGQTYTAKLLVNIFLFLNLKTHISSFKISKTYKIIHLKKAQRY